MKLIVVAVVSFWEGLSDIGAWLLSWLGNDDTAQVIFTMGLFPIFMNIIQFWVIDSIIKVGGVGGLGVQLEEPDVADHEPLFHDPDGGEDEDDADLPPVPKHDVESQTQTRLRHSTDSTHTYPPSLPGSPTGPSTTLRYASVSPPPISRSLPLLQHPRSPAPLLPPSNVVPAVNSHSLPSKAGEGVGARTKEDWQAWDGEEEDWADRAGEEDWTGRQAEDGKGEADGT